MYTIEYNFLIYNRDTVLLYCKMEKFYFTKIYRDNFPQLVDICTIPYIIRYLKLQSYLYAKALTCSFAIAISVLATQALPYIYVMFLFFDRLGTVRVNVA